MWKIFPLLVGVSFYLQVATCSPSCLPNGLKASCVAQKLRWVPALPANITHLILPLNSIRAISSASLRHFRELEEFNLDQQDVTLTIKNNAFHRQRKLTRLFLSFNSGLRLEPMAFSGLSNLKDLYLSDCSLNDSILSGRYLEPLASLELLDLSGNDIVTLKPGLFFSRLTNFTQLNLKRNQIQTLCEEDLVGFRGKYFTHLNLFSNKLYTTSNLGSCGNPFKGIAFDTLDLSNNGLNENETRAFFKAIEGTSISQLIYCGLQGKGFSHDNFNDPNESTFEGLKNSAVRTLVLSKSKIFALQRAVFSHLKEVVIIDVSQNHLNQIEKNAFDGLQDHLRMLNLSFNLLGEIRSHTFINLRELRVLDLSNNHIGVLGYSSFSGLPKLRALYMTGNSLKDLGFPEALPNLEYLLLGNNNLESIYKVDHLGMSSTYVDISNNKLTNLEDVYFIVTRFKYLKTLFFGGNNIQWCTLNGGITIPRNNSVLVLDIHDSSLQVVWERKNCLDLFDNFTNLLGLILSFNSLSALPQGIFRGLSSIREINLSFNALTHLQTDVFPVSLRLLDLSNNNLASPDPQTFQSLTFVDLSANQFRCDCHLESFLKWINVTNVTFLSPLEEYRCEFPDELRSHSLLIYSTNVETCDEDDEPFLQELKFALFVFSALLTMTAVLSAVIYTHLRGQIFVFYKRIINRVVEGPKPTAPPTNELQYDAFLCFSNNDYRWVEEALLKKLDNQFAEENVFHCCFEDRDFLPGENHLSNIRNAIWSSRKTLVIVSKQFLKDGWCLEAFSLAQGRMLEELTNVLVMLVVGKVAHYQLMKSNTIRSFVRRKEYLTFPEDPQDLDWFYERLMSEMRKDTKVKKVADNRPDPAEPDAEGGIQLKNM
ncbi:toll-like receptor 5 [Salarias fasciatus]|uniref:TIR domain-containing protein n=1 Tax=Salarias fasciatus TaxID=181472 RepID=A0A672HQ35_SALFA|nr:toll-like receptor 5 [Salarias fasciatus]